MLSKVEHTAGSHVDALFASLPQEFQVWMSHGDKLLTPPEGFITIGNTPSAPLAAIAHTSQPSCEIAAFLWEGDQGEKWKCRLQREEDCPNSSTNAISKGRAACLDHPEEDRSPMLARALARQGRVERPRSRGAREDRGGDFFPEVSLRPGSST